MLIALTGRKRSGKDTVADHIRDNYGFEKTSIGDPLKHSLKHLFGFTDEQLWGDKKNEIDPRWGISPRVAMQRYGGEFLLDKIYDLFPEIEAMAPRGMFKMHAFKDWYNKKLYFDAVLSDVLEEDEYRKKLYNLVIADTRYALEADELRKLGAIVVKIVRPNSENNEDLHMSESEVDLIEADYTIENESSIEALLEEVDELMAELGVDML